MTEVQILREALQKIYLDIRRCGLLEQFGLEENDYIEAALSTTSEKEDDFEKVLCAAIWYKEQTTAKILPKNINIGVVVGGFRHAYCIHTFVALTGKRSVLPECGEYVQGFLTDKDRFVDRVEAMKLAKENGQVPQKQSFEELFSEDLY